MLQVDVPIPVLLATLSVPSEVSPSKNSTLPVGAADPLTALTIAVKVTASPYVEGFGLPVTAVVVAVLRLSTRSVPVFERLAPVAEVAVTVNGIEPAGTAFVVVSVKVVAARLLVPLGEKAAVTPAGRIEVMLYVILLLLPL